MTQARRKTEPDIPTELASLLIPLSDRVLLLPNVTVAEIIPYQAIVADTTTPDWHLGALDWRGVKIPLISLDIINGHQEQPATRDSRMVVVNGLGKYAKLPFYAFVAGGIPRLIRVFDQDLAPQDAAVGPAEKMHVQLSGEHVVIPDLDIIEDKIIGRKV